MTARSKSILATNKKLTFNDLRGALGLPRRTKRPTLRALTKQLRELHEAWSRPHAGGEYVGLVDAGPDVGWVLESPPHPDLIGRELIPGDGAPFDAVAAARRLLGSLP